MAIVSAVRACAKVLHWPEDHGPRWSWRYTFHWIYVGILDTVTTVTIQLFVSHRLLVLIGARWSSTERIFIPWTLIPDPVDRKTRWSNPLKLISRSLRPKETYPRPSRAAKVKFVWTPQSHFISRSAFIPKEDGVLPWATRLAAAPPSAAVTGTRARNGSGNGRSRPR